jgi:S-adenosyl methyltransferase
MTEADFSTANPARIYDYMLGGSANFAVDRQAADKLLALEPQTARYMRANRAFLRRVVAYLARAGVDQFLELGSGVPTVGHVHEVAGGINPAARVVYVDNEPVAAAYGQRLLADVPGTAMVVEDIRDPDGVLAHPDTRALLDLDRPVAVLMMAVLHFVLDDERVAEMVTAYRDRTAGGSYLAVSHSSGERHAATRQAEEQYRSTSQPFRSRTIEAIRGMFTGYELVEPGVVYIGDWHPDPGTDPYAVEGPQVIAGGLGRKPQ